MILKIHKSDRTIVALCDSDILGKRFEQGNLQLDLTTDFYKGKEVTEQEAAKIVPSADILNLVGEKSVGLGIKLGLIEKNNVIRIKDIPHAQAALYT
ncbi:MAG: DUF424 family protein [Nanoarchaeota archaeon]|nr:DUF424 family protein [Nanoarchaeota archaeon]MBU1705064.1 DUF424 family protein [Nanoarchaeota archaeon]